MRIIGIDPGSIICGYGVIDKSGPRISLVEYGIVRAGKKHESMPSRLKEIYSRLSQVIERSNPELAALETVFFSKNAQSLAKLSHARGAAMLAAAMRDLPVFEYSPREVKKSVTGRGNAAKEQVRYMVLKLLKIEETPEFLDSTDALAVAICHSYKSALPKKGSNSWKDFVKNNPDRLIDINRQRPR